MESRASRKSSLSHKNYKIEQTRIHRPTYKKCHSLTKTRETTGCIYVPCAWWTCGSATETWRSRRPGTTPGASCRTPRSPSLLAARTCQCRSERPLTSSVVLFPQENEYRHPRQITPRVLIFCKMRNIRTNIKLHGRVHFLRQEKFYIMCREKKTHTKQYSSFVNPCHICSAVAFVLLVFSKTKYAMARKKVERVYRGSIPRTAECVLDVRGDKVRTKRPPAATISPPPCNTGVDSESTDLQSILHFKRVQYIETKQSVNIPPTKIT